MHHAQASPLDEKISMYLSKYKNMNHQHAFTYSMDMQLFVSLHIKLYLRENRTQDYNYIDEMLLTI